MSRCFPYPPPGYENSYSLIESISKLQKEREKPKKEREREKRGRKEKSRRNTEKTEDKKHSHKKRHYEELSQSTHKAVNYVKTTEDESEQLEKSSLTEDQGSPATVQNIFDSSDSSTQNRSKRSKHESAEVSRSTHGNVLRIRLPLSRRKDVEPSVSSDQPCFSGRTEEVAPLQEARVTAHRDPPSHDAQPCSSGRTDTTPFEELRETTHGRSVSSEADGSHGSSRSHHDRDVRRLYKKLMLEWNPPPLETVNPADDDQDWLFGSPSRRHHGQGGTRDQRAAGEDSGLGSALCSWPPRARYLPEVGIHALPYVVPF